MIAKVMHTITMIVMMIRIMIDIHIKATKITQRFFFFFLLSIAIKLKKKVGPH